METLENPKKKKSHSRESVLSPEAWASLRAASMSGTSDSDLAEVYEVKEATIRKRRSLDKAWSIATGLRRRSIGGQGPVSQHVKAITSITKPGGMTKDQVEKAEIGAIIATFSDENQAARLLSLQIAQKGLRASLEGDGGLKAHLAPTEPQHVKVYADIAAKAGQWGADTQITVNCQAYAGAAVARENTDEAASILDV